MFQKTERALAQQSVHSWKKSMKHDHQYHRRCLAWSEGPSQHTHASSLTWSKKSKTNSIQLKIHSLRMNDTGAVTLLYLSFCWNDTETTALREVLLSDRNLTPLKACKGINCVGKVFLDHFHRSYEFYRSFCLQKFLKRQPFRSIISLWYFNFVRILSLMISDGYISNDSKEIK